MDVENHCKNCCCAQSWKALGITAYTGKSIPEHVAELVERNKGLAVLLQSVGQRISTVPVTADEEDGARSAIFDIGCYIATFGDMPESILDADEIERLRAKVEELDALAYNNGEAYNKEHLLRIRKEQELYEVVAELDELRAGIKKEQTMGKPAETFCGKPCPCGCVDFYMSITAKKVPTSVTCARCRKQFNPYNGEYVEHEVSR